MRRITQAQLRRLHLEFQKRGTVWPDRNAALWECERRDIEFALALIIRQERYRGIAAYTRSIVSDTERWEP